MATGKTSFVLYCDLIHTVELLTDEQAGKLMKHLLQYVNDMDPETSDVVVRLAFEPIKRHLIHQWRRRESGHWNWKGGVTPINRSLRNCGAAIKWRKLVLKRDCYTCQICGSSDRTLHVHHKKPFSTFPDLRFDINNGLTLCKPCHINTHKKRS